MRLWDQRHEITSKHNLQTIFCTILPTRAFGVELAKIQRRLVVSNEIYQVPRDHRWGHASGLCKRTPTNAVLEVRRCN